jgi:hypothetical protein
MLGVSYHFLVPETFLPRFWRFWATVNAYFLECFGLDEFGSKGMANMALPPH